MGKIINASIKSTLSEKPWPPTPDDIISTKYEIKYTCGQLNDTGLVMLPKWKAEKVLQVCQNIESLLPNTKPSLDQVLLSLTIHR